MEQNSKSSLVEIVSIELKLDIVDNLIEAMSADNHASVICLSITGTVQVISGSFNVWLFKKRQILQKKCLMVQFNSVQLYWSTILASIKSNWLCFNQDDFYSCCFF